MLVERFERVGLVILGADREDDPALGKLFGVVLHCEESLAECAALSQHDAVEAVVADHAAPQRVVEIEHKALARFAGLRGQHPDDEIAVNRRRGRANVLLCPMPEHGIMPFGEAVARGFDVNRHQIDAFDFAPCAHA